MSETELRDEIERLKARMARVEMELRRQGHKKPSPYPRPDPPAPNPYHPISPIRWGDPGIDDRSHPIYRKRLL